MDEPRFYVVSVRGQKITPDVGIRGGRLITSYSVLDAAQCHREVFTAYAEELQGRNDQARRIRCEREAARRNALDAAGCAA